VKKNVCCFSIDTGADLGLVKGKRLIGSTGYDPRKKVKVKSVEWSEIETFGTVEAKVQVGHNCVPFEFQLVNTQTDVPCDGILGRDFLLYTKAKICYETQKMTTGQYILKLVNATNWIPELGRVTTEKRK
jgi:hypothetical protein